MLGSHEDDTKIVLRGKKEHKTPSMTQNVIWNSSGSTFYLVCQWLLTVIVVRFSSGFDDAGILALAMAIGNVFSQLANYRMRTYQVSDLAGELSIGQYFAFRLLTITLAFMACVAYSVFTCDLNQTAIIVLYMVYKAIEQVIDCLHGEDQLHGRMDYVGKSFFLRGALSLVSFATTLLVFNNLFAAILNMIILTSLCGILYDWRKTNRLARITLGISARKAGQYLKKCLLPTMSLCACNLAVTIPRQYLSFIDGDAALGIYASVASPIAIVQMGISYLYFPLMGHFGALYSAQQNKEYVILLAKVLGASLVLIVLLLFLFDICGSFILGFLFGDEIVGYAYLIPPLILCALLTGFLWLFNDLLLAARKTLVAFVGNTLSIVVTTFFSAWFIDLWGMNGVSFVIIVSYGIAVAVLLCAVLFLLNRMRKTRDDKTVRSQEGF